MKTIRLVVEYDGTNLSGWQIQEGPEGVPTVQGHLQRALHAFTGAVTRVRGASRTDAGVHARGQVAAFDTESSIPARGFERGLRNHLPRTIVVRRAEEVEVGWDPRRASRGKRYIYRLWNDSTPTALDRWRAWWVRGHLDLERMKEAARVLVGTHDFDAFRAVGCVAKHAVRTIYRVDVEGQAPGSVDITVVGNAFVRNMVRIFAGTLVEAGRGRMSAETVKSALEAGQRHLAGPTAPAHGLCLEEVIYDHRLPPRPHDDQDLVARGMSD